MQLHTGCGNTIITGTIVVASHTDLNIAFIAAKGL
jgi:hypothetical protein